MLRGRATLGGGRTVRCVRARNVVVALCALVAVACSPGGDEPEAAAPAPSSSWTVEQRAYLEALGRIDPGLVASEERAITRAGYMCADIAKGEMTEQQLVDRTVFRLSGGNATITAEQGAQALALMRQHICPHLP